MYQSKYGLVFVYMCVAINLELSTKLTRSESSFFDLTLTITALGAQKFGEGLGKSLLEIA